MFRAVSRTDDPRWRVGLVNTGQERFASFYNPSTGDIVEPTDGYSIPQVFRAKDSSTLSIGQPVKQDGGGLFVPLAAPSDLVVGIIASLPFLLESRASIHVPKVTKELTGSTVYTQYAVNDINGVLPLESHIGTIVALATSGGDWGIDVNDTTPAQLRIEDIDETRSEFIVTFVNSAIQAVT